MGWSTLMYWQIFYEVSSRSELTFLSFSKLSLLGSWPQLDVFIYIIISVIYE